MDKDTLKDIEEYLQKTKEIGLLNMFVELNIDVKELSEEDFCQIRKIQKSIGIS